MSKDKPDNEAPSASTPKVIPNLSFVLDKFTLLYQKQAREDYQDTEFEQDLKTDLVKSTEHMKSKRARQARVLAQWKTKEAQNIRDIYPLLHPVVTTVTGSEQIDSIVDFNDHFTHHDQFPSDVFHPAALPIYDIWHNLYQSGGLTKREHDWMIQTEYELNQDFIVTNEKTRESKPRWVWDHETLVFKSHLLRSLFSTSSSSSLSLPVLTKIRGVHSSFSDPTDSGMLHENFYVDCEFEGFNFAVELGLMMITPQYQKKALEAYQDYILLPCFESCESSGTLVYDRKKVMQT